MLFGWKDIQQKYNDELEVKIWLMVIKWWHNKDIQRHEDNGRWVIFHTRSHMVICDLKSGWEDDL